MTFKHVAVSAAMAATVMQTIAADPPVLAAEVNTSAGAAASRQVQTDNIGGVSLASLDDGATTLKVAGDAKIVSYSARSGSVEAMVQLGTKASPRAGSDGTSVVDLAIALGMPPDKAQSAFGMLAQHAAEAGGPAGVRYSAVPVVAPSGSDESVGGQADRRSAASADQAAAAGAASRTYWTQYCASVDGGSGKRVHGYG